MAPHLLAVSGFALLLIAWLTDQLERPWLGEVTIALAATALLLWLV